MVTLTNKTNRHIEIESKDGKVTVINSMETSGLLDEKKFTDRTNRLIKELKLLKTEIPTEETKVEKVPMEESTVVDKPIKKKSTYKK